MKRIGFAASCVAFAVAAHAFASAFAFARDAMVASTVAAELPVLPASSSSSSSFSSPASSASSVSNAKALSVASASASASPASPALPASSASTTSAASTASVASAASVERRNWYDDPFWALSHSIAECPTPLGPLMTRAQMEDDAHYRVERGTTCWLAHRCSKPNAYLYDKPIAGELKKRFADGDPALAGTSIWITIQRRFVYAEGCVSASFDRDALRRRLEALPDVERVFLRLTDDPRGRAPYKTLVAPD
ncbi:transport-associated protein [Burkholderia pseudomallei]|nr:transport-associated protein [Burkholderia pseudomallei]CAJ7183390.1 transport-associated protein [Burkholderia pseudomallei]CAJ7833172.1 transport-associated protein [Burkholderia pseudomallei]CAK0203074.1 transport-associated protein [Burkholderia pseudomallei]